MRRWFGSRRSLRIEKRARRVEMFSEHLNGSAAVPADGYGVPPGPRPFLGKRVFEDAGVFCSQYDPEEGAGLLAPFNPS